MTTIKAYTDLEQSRKLEKILPLESADMYYEGTKEEQEYKVYVGRNIAITHNLFSYRNGNTLPCWSLAALLSVLPKTIPHKDANYVEDRKYWTYSWLLTSKCLLYKCSILTDYGGKYDDVFAEVHYQDNIVDACYEMILKLNELKML